ncbi:hypothetical protein [Rhizosphaericola mali]|uniref:Uncharacterized protein n=1 Tax=Rhizosphaericola mali TaxID=2545455 RepID=A0A5P2GCI6_9BACT|nr:hypothetical protein [Rhizosphaericola mali]QES89291.1 hypothetical protein E0W69_011660 [Rhizosphaericola mali]
MLYPSIISIVILTIIVLIISKRKIHLHQDKLWNLVNSSYEEFPKRPSNLTKEKIENIYIDRYKNILDTKTVTNIDPVTLIPKTKISKIGDLESNSLPLYTTIHSDEEHFLTTLHLSFHSEGDTYFMDLLSLNKDFPLDNNNTFSMLFVNNQQWNFTFEKTEHNDFAKSIPISEEQLQFLSKTKVDKWMLCRTADHYYAVGGLNFEIRKYIYKPELQFTIQTMAKTILEHTKTPVA